MPQCHALNIHTGKHNGYHLHVMPGDEWGMCTDSSNSWNYFTRFKVFRVFIAR